MNFFIYKENTDDRDSVKYIDFFRIGKLELGHYYPSINLVGACFSQGINLEEIDFDNIQTVLTKEDFENLSNYNKKIDELGTGIEQGDERYYKGIEYYNDIQATLKKIISDENEELFKEVVKEEKEFVKEEYGLTDEEVEYIFKKYSLEYQDRGIIGYVFDDIETASKEEAESIGYVTRENERYFDYEKFGEDLLMSDNIIELESGKIVILNY